jgi:hypothetical protein
MCVVPFPTKYFFCTRSQQDLVLEVDGFNQESKWILSAELLSANSASILSFIRCLSLSNLRIFDTDKPAIKIKFNTNDYVSRKTFGLLKRSSFEFDTHWIDKCARNCLANRITEYLLLQRNQTSGTIQKRSSWIWSSRFMGERKLSTNGW